MRILLTAVVATACVLSAPLQLTAQSHARTNPGTKCGNQSAGVPDYYDAIYSYIEPPGWRQSLIRISVGEGTEIALSTDGREFKIWTDITEPRNIERFLLELNAACRLPADPADVFALLKIRWESADLAPTVFAQIHKDLVEALSQYVSSTQQRYDQMKGFIYLDTPAYKVRYQNSYERIEVLVRDDPKEHKGMLEWIDQLKQLFQEKFHRPFGVRGPT